MNDNLINYVEGKARNIIQVKAFYTDAFGRRFTDYGPEFTAFSDSGLEGGFELTDSKVVNRALVVLYHADLTIIRDKIILSKGIISKDIFSFPGGHRFHFIDPSGNELAVWSDQ